RKSPEEEAFSISEEEIRKLVDEEYEKTKERLESLTDETVSYSMEKAERALEKVSNEKMIAFGEYSDNVMTQINKNHNEVVFLNDMLSRSRDDLTNLLGQAMKDAKSATDISTGALERAKEANGDAEAAMLKSKAALDSSVVAEEKMISARRHIEGSYEEPAASDEKPSKKSKKSQGYTVKTSSNDIIEGQMSILDYEDNDFLNMSDDSDNKDSRTGTEKKKKSTRGRKSSKTKDAGPALNFRDGENGENNNEKILKLHKAGKSNVAIAKELSLGVGEVQLVIDLFK
ncbi:MAG: hypothetical protein IKR70_07925, partial [Lachnospiraceae bacterium]|nr:hypothetical protein [Lachnospiraceae bacterium]